MCVQGDASRVMGQKQTGVEEVNKTEKIGTRHLRFAGENAIRFIEDERAQATNSRWARMKSVAYLSNKLPLRLFLLYVLPCFRYRQDDRQEAARKEGATNCGINGTEGFQL